jgi:hypothetical protein
MSDTTHLRASRRAFLGLAGGAAALLATSAAPVQAARVKPRRELSFWALALPVLPWPTVWPCVWMAHRSR